MGPFEPPDSPEVPAVVLAYAEARRRWLAVAYDPTRRGDPAVGAFARASEALAKALRARGGRWEVGGLIYHLERHGIAIEQAADPAEPVAAADGGGPDAAIV